MTKVCTKCGESKNATTEHFFKKGGGRNGLRAICKQCENRANKEYRDNNKEKISKTKKLYNQTNKKEIAEYKKIKYKEDKKEISEKSKEYYKENREVISAKVKEYRKNNVEQVRKSKRENYLKNRNHISDWHKLYYENNKETIKKYVRDYNKDNPHIKRISNQKRKAIKNKVINTLTMEEWVDTKLYFNNKCCYCGMSEELHIKDMGHQLQQDHFVPLKEYGGYTKGNIVPSCVYCNTSKKASDFKEWYRSFKHYDEDRENKILEYIGIYN